MRYHPATLQELIDSLSKSRAKGERGIAFNLNALNRIVEYNPADMTVTAETGLTLAALQKDLRTHGQWLPIDAPNPETTSLADLINFNSSGPRRFGYGTIREHLLGLTVVLADGRVIHSGGKVVKNVAGYDLCKLFVGSQGSLGVTVEATFKVRPLPEAEQFVGVQCTSFAQAGALLEALHESEITPVVLDLYRGAEVTEHEHATLVLGLAGTREEVDWQLAKAAALGLNTEIDLAYEKSFWRVPDHPAPHRLSILPSRLIQVLSDLEMTEWVARAGNGVIYYRGGKAPPQAALPSRLMQRIKATYDPNNLFP